MKKISQKFIYAASLISLAAVGCGGSGGKGSTVTSPGTYALTVTSVNPVSGLPLTVSPADINSAGASGAPAPVTDLSLIYNAGTAVTLTAPASTGSGAFVAWVGCDSTTGYACSVTMSASKSVEVEYAGVSSITIVPTTLSVAAGGSVQIPFVVNGYGMCANPTDPTQPSIPCAGSPVSFSPSLPDGVTGSPGSIDQATGVYTPDPTNPASSVNVTVQSTISSQITAVVLIELQQ